MFRLINQYFKDKKRYFLITSHGQTATLWLAATINKHPDIFCSHAYTYPQEETLARELTPKQNQQRMKTSAERFWKLSLDQFFDEVEEVTQKRVMGNIHGFTLGHLMNLLPSLASKRKRQLTLMNMVRHPVTRIMSMFRNWTHPTIDTFIVPFVAKDFETRCHHILTHIQKNFSVNFDSVRNKTFVVTLLAIEDISRDVKIAHKKNIPNITFEQVTTDKDYLKKIIKKISASTIKLEDNLLSEMFATDRINKHNQQSILSPQEQYQKWETWQRSAFNFVMKRDELIKLYSPFGYDLSFTK